MIEDYVPIFFVFVLAVTFVLSVLGLTHFLGPRAKSPAKSMAYESGVDPIAASRIRFSVKYFLVGLLFIIFDIEIVYLFPWAVVFKEFLSAGSFIFLEMVIFLSILLFGYLFVWRTGALEWE